MIKVVVSEIDLFTYEHLRYIFFDIDDGKDFYYRGRNSSNAFFHSVKWRNKNKKKKLLYVEKDEVEFNITNDIRDKLYKDKKIDNPHKDVPRVYVDNIWEFYKLIGYDYKKRKYS